MISDASIGGEIQAEPHGLPPIDQDFLDTLPLLTAEQLGTTFEELADIAATQPDDVLVIEKINYLVGEAVQRGEINTAMQMAMTLGAMACNHAHLEAPANSVGSSVFKIASLEISGNAIEANIFGLPSSSEDDDEEEKKRKSARK